MVDPYNFNDKIMTEHPKMCNAFKVVTLDISVNAGLNTWKIRDET